MKQISTAGALQCKVFKLEPTVFAPNSLPEAEILAKYAREYFFFLHIFKTSVGPIFQQY